MESSETPLLERRQSLVIKPPRSWRIAALCLGAVIGGVLAYYDPFGPEALPLALLFWQVGVAVHEAGHVAAGLLTGFAFRGVAVCGFTAGYGMRGWRFGFEWRKILGGGRAYMLPVSESMEDWRYGLMIAGGPLASILLFLATWLMHANSVLLAVSGFFVVVSLIPMVGLKTTDVAVLSMIARQTPDWYRLKLLLPAQALNFDGVRPRLWNADGLRKAMEIEGGHAAIAVQTWLFSYIVFIDREESDAAAAALERALALTPRLTAVYRSLIFLMAADFLAKQRTNTIAAREWFEDAMKVKGLPKTAVLPVEARLLAAEGDHEKAAQKASSALTELRRRPFSDATTMLVIDDLSECANMTA